MNVSDVQKVLESSNGEQLIDCTVLSTGESFSFRPMTVGARKTLAKFSLNEFNKDSALAFQVAKLGLLKTLCTDEKFNIDVLTEIDFTYLLAIIRQFNILDDLIATIPCSKCHKVNSHTVDLMKIIKHCEAFKFKTCEHEVKDKHNVWKFILKDPKMYDSMELEKYIIEKTSNTEIDRELLKPFLYIDEIYFNGTKIDGNNGRLSIIEKILLLNGTNDRVYYGPKGVLRAILENYDYNKVTEMYDDITCSCGNVMEGIITSDSFFIF